MGEAINHYGASVQITTDSIRQTIKKLNEFTLPSYNIVMQPFIFDSLKYGLEQPTKFDNDIRHGIANLKKKKEK